MAQIIKNITLLLFISFFLYSCSSKPEQKGFAKNKTESSNPIDTILGDKILDMETNKIRKNNFESLIGLENKYLFLESELYSIQRLNTTHFLLNQKKKYFEARSFSILLKTDKKKVIGYVVFNDFETSDIKQDSDNWIVLLSDFNHPNKYWKSKQQIKIVKLDSNFNPIWSYNRSGKLPLDGQSMEIRRDTYTFEINIIIGCQICFETVELTLSKQGEFKSVKAIGGQNSQGLYGNTRNEIFN